MVIKDNIEGNVMVMASKGNVLITVIGHKR
jgi:hypothetical protein